MMLYISTSASRQMVGSIDTGCTGKEQNCKNWIQPSSILTELDHYILFPAGSILHTPKFGDDCNHCSPPPSTEHPRAIYFILLCPGGALLV